MTGLNHEIGSMPDPLPMKLLTPLLQSGLFDSFGDVDFRGATGLTTVAPMPVGIIDMFDVMIAARFHEWVGHPDWTSESGHWLEGDVVASVAWTSPPGWILDVGVYRFHPDADGPGALIRIYRGSRPMAVTEKTPEHCPGASSLHD